MYLSFPGNGRFFAFVLPCGLDCQRLVTLPQAPFRRSLDKIVLILRHIGDRFPQVPQYDFFQHYTADGVRLAQGTVFPIGGADVILLFRLEVVGPAKVHLAAAIGAVHQPGEHTHVPHFGRVASGLPDVLHDQEHTFLNNRLLGVLEPCVDKKDTARNRQNKI